METQLTSLAKELENLKSFPNVNSSWLEHVQGGILETQEENQPERKAQPDSKLRTHK